jgi:hypothetical protein
MSLIIEINASAKMFYLLKHLLLLYLVIFKSSYNNLIFTLIMVLYASYVCLLHSRFIENHPIDLEATNPLFLRWFCHRRHLAGGRASSSTPAAPLTAVGIDKTRHSDLSNQSIWFSCFEQKLLAPYSNLCANNYQKHSQYTTHHQPLPDPTSG